MKYIKISLFLVASMYIISGVLKILEPKQATNTIEYLFSQLFSINISSYISVTLAYILIFCESVLGLLLFFYPYKPLIIVSAFLMNILFTIIFYLFRFWALENSCGCFVSLSVYLSSYHIYILHFSNIALIAAIIFHWRNRQNIIQPAKVH